MGSILPSFYRPFRAVRGSRRSANVQKSKAVARKICVELLSGEGGILKEKVKAIETCSKPLLGQLELWETSGRQSGGTWDQIWETDSSWQTTFGRQLDNKWRHLGDNWQTRWKAKWETRCRTHNGSGRQGSKVPRTLRIHGRTLGNEGEIGIPPLLVTERKKGEIDAMQSKIALGEYEGTSFCN